MSLAEIGAALRTVLDTLAQARAQRSASVATAASARDRIVSLAQGSANPTLDHAAASLTAGVSALG